MSDESKPQEAPAPADAAPADAAPADAAVPADAESEANEEVLVGIVTDGAHALIVAQFPNLVDAEAAYEELKELERTTSIRIDGVVVASCDEEGKIHLGKVTEHSTKTGLKWGLVGGVALGIIFPPSILASAATFGVIGAAFGKIRNVLHRSGVADDLAGALQPGTSGIIAVVEDTAVVEIRAALDKADSIVTKAIDKQMAAEIQREADLAKEQLKDA
jgi:uncharacterized membrane protein